MTLPLLIAPVVEGDGEVQALPVLLRRICSEILGEHHVQIRPPWRVPRDRMQQDVHLGPVARTLSTACRDRRGGILVLFDLDDDECALTSALHVRGRFPAEAAVEVVVACREFEAWFLAAAPSLAPHPSLRESPHFDGDPESPRDAKGRLEDLMIEQYRPTLHQARLASLMSLDVASERSRSFRRLVSAVSELASRG